MVFSVVLAISGLPLYLSFIFGGIALATAPAPALSIVNEYHTRGPVTKTLIPLAAIDDVIGVIVFFTVISIVEGVGGDAQTSVISVIGMAYSAATVNLIPEEKTEQIMSLYNPLLTLSLVVVIANLGMPLDYRLIAGAGVFTFTYMISRAVGKIGGAYLGGKITKAEPVVTKYLGLTLLPHSGVSLVFTGIAVATLNRIDPSSASVISGTIVAAAIINEIIAVLIAKYAFQWAGELSD